MVRGIINNASSFSSYCPFVLGICLLVSSSWTKAQNDLPSGMSSEKVVIQPLVINIQLQPNQKIVETYITLVAAEKDLTISAERPMSLVGMQNNEPIHLTRDSPKRVYLYAAGVGQGNIEIRDFDTRISYNIPFKIVGPKLVNQGMSFNYLPSSDLLSVNYSLSNVMVRPFDP